MSQSPPLLTARKIYEAALIRLADEKGVHPETVCSLLGCVLGMALLRKHYVADFAAACAMVDQDTPNILAALGKLAEENGMVLEVSWPPHPLPEKHAPVFAPDQLITTHGESLRQHLEQDLQSPQERLLASLFAVLFIIQRTKAMFPTTVAMSLVLEGFIVGAKFPHAGQPEIPH